MPLQSGQQPTTRGLPQPDRPIPVAAGYQLSIPAQRHGPDLSDTALQGRHQPPTRQPVHPEHGSFTNAFACEGPQLDGTVLAGAGQQSSVRA